MKASASLLALFASIGFSSVATANCECRCVDGEVRAICSSSIDLEPICSPRICPITNPSVTPIQRPVVPPIGTETCEQKQVYNEYTHQYEWKEICH